MGRLQPGPSSINQISFLRLNGKVKGSLKRDNTGSPRQVKLALRRVSLSMSRCLASFEAVQNPE